MTTHLVPRWHVDYAALVEGKSWVTRVQTFTSIDNAQVYAASIRQHDYIRCVSVTGPFDHEVPT